MDTLPVELLHVIASSDEASYRALLAIPLFGRSLTPGAIVDYKISFGYSVRIAFGWGGYKYTKWVLNRKLHRKDGPAIEYDDGTKMWYINDKLHRKDGPAIEYPNGERQWFINGKLHREDGPAIERDDGTKMWYINGKLHRKDGPAIEYSNGGRQ